jgi:WxL domain surface cell wall-binding
LLRKQLLVTFILGAAFWAFPAMALGASATATGTLTGSTLSLSTSATPSFSANLDLGDSTPTYTVPLTIQDTRGTGAGWNATITSTQFTTGGGTPSTLATNASSLTGVTSACASGTCTNPTNSITYPVAVPAAPTAPAAVKFFNAAANTGMGKFTNTPTIGVFVPQSSVAGTYTSTLTISIVSGP